MKHFHADRIDAKLAFIFPLIKRAEEILESDDPDRLITNTHAHFLRSKMKPASAFGSIPISRSDSIALRCIILFTNWAIGTAWQFARMSNEAAPAGVAKSMVTTSPPKCLNKN